MSDLIDAAYWCVLQVSMIVIAGLSLAAIASRRERAHLFVLRFC